MTHKKNDGFFGRSNIHFLHKMKDCGSVDDAYVMDQLDLASVTQNYLLEKWVLDSFTYYCHHFRVKKKKNVYIYINLEIYICTGCAKLEIKEVHGSWHSLCLSVDNHE